VRSELAELAAGLLDHVEVQRQLGAQFYVPSFVPARAGAPSRVAPEPLRQETVRPVPATASLRSGSVGETNVHAPVPTLSTPLPGPRLANRGEALKVVAAEASGCTKCRLHEGRTQVVFGVGSPDAELVFVGEAPGRNEDLQGEPFVGDAGQLLDKMIVAMGLRRPQVYICNIIKCRPPSNRQPLPDEIEKCEPYLLEQLGILSPKVIVALGSYAAQTLLRTSDGITRLRGKFFRYHDIELMPTFHPAYLLRNPSAKRTVWEDLQKVQEKLGIPVGSYADKPPYVRPS